MIAVSSPYSVALRLYIQALLCVACRSSPVSTERQAGQADAQGFLEKYGYLHQEEHRHNAAELQSAVQEFQWLAHLPVTGHLDSVTLGKMAAPRCGVKDGGSHRAWGKRVNAVFTGGSSASGGQRPRKKRYTQTGQWACVKTVPDSFVVRVIPCGWYDHRMLSLSVFLLMKLGLND
ncbi:matrix metalloproteinase-28 [Clupea harengus]|uniref:Matrix metalloproteinase-28 n=1 Tax=Clupea harengus TaxID=7950 RepID=A0A6P8FZ76_CLUHA|nr:matrix metalloproteinase-28 [Clupea harengus]